MGAMMPAGPTGAMGMMGAMAPPAAGAEQHHEKKHKSIFAKVCGMATTVITILWVLDLLGVIGPVRPDGLHPSPSPPSPSSIVALVSDVNSLCLDLSGNVESEGIPIQAYGCDPSAPTQSQRWFVSQDHDAGHEIFHMSSDGRKLCLDLKDNEHQNGTPLQVWSCAGSPQQRWTLENDGITTDDGTKCVSVDAQDPSKVQIWDCVSGEPTQRWRAAIPSELFIA